MKRPLFVAGICYLGTMAAVFHLGLPLGLLTACLAGAAAGCARRHYGAARTMAVSALCAAAVFSLYTALAYVPVAGAAGEKVWIRATVLESERWASTLSCGVAADIEEGRAAGRTVMLRLYCNGELPADVGDGIRCQVELRPVSDSPSVRQSQLAEGYWLGAVARGEIVAADAPYHPVRALFARFRSWAVGRVERLLPGWQGDVLSSMMLGTGHMPASIKKQFRDAGVSHIVAVSGLHLAIFSALIGSLLTAAGVRGRVAGAASLAAVALFAVASGLSPSVLRAAVMVGLTQIGVMIGRQSDGLNSLGATALILCTINPYRAGSLSYQLSFLATLGILLVSPAIRKAFAELAARLGAKGGWTRRVGSTLSVSLAAQLFTLPVTATVFGSVSLVALPANLAILILVPFVLGFGLVAAIFGGVPVASGALSAVCGLLVRTVVRLAGLFAGLPLASVSLRESYQMVWLWGAAALGALLILVRLDRRAVLGGAAAVLLSLLLGTGVFALAAGPGVEYLYFEETGAVAVVRREGTLLIGVPKDAGDVYDTVAALERLGTAPLTVFALSEDGVLSPGMTRMLTLSAPAQIKAPDSAAAKGYFRTAGVAFGALGKTEREISLRLLETVRLMAQKDGQRGQNYAIIGKEFAAPVEPIVSVPHQTGSRADATNDLLQAVSQQITEDNAVRVWSPVAGVRRYRIRT
jgi:ComEC/Rec2-related protein